MRLETLKMKIELVDVFNFFNTPENLKFLNVMYSISIKVTLQTQC